jgi:hypothetical protein
MNAYDADLRIPEFTGIMQYGDGINADPRTASEAMNMETVGGVLQPMGACKLLTPSCPATIETLAWFHRRWPHEGESADVLVAAAGKQLYSMPEGGSAWMQLTLPEGWVGIEYASNVWSFVAYEINPEGSTGPVDVLLMSNAQDGMICIRGDNMTVTAVNTPKKFGVIARCAERIWGGGITDDPDMLVFSAAFNPLDWTANPVIPEDGAGDVMQPSWDGDSFHALKQLGSQLIAFKKNRIWRVLNTDPAEFVFKEQYGGGTAYFNTIASEGERILMLGDDCVMQYDGLNAAPFQKEACQTILASMNTAALQQACACVFRDAYYCAIPIGASDYNNAVLIYNFRLNTWLYRTDVSVESFLPTGTKLYFTSHTAPGRIHEWGADAWTSGAAATPCRWVSQWQDFQQKTIRKGSFEVYFILEAKDTGTLTFTIETEKKIKEKAYAFVSTTSQTAVQKRVRLGGSGRRFRLIISSAGSTAWRMIGGVQIRTEIDAD